MAVSKVIPLALPAQAIPRKTNRSTMAYLSPEEILAVLKTARGRSVRDWAMILLAYRHGLRASEVCGVQTGRHRPEIQFGFDPAPQRLTEPSAAALPTSRSAIAR